MIEDDDLSSLTRLGLTFKEIEELRFEYDMNFLQLVCHEEALKILVWLTHTKLKDNERMRTVLAAYRDSHLGSQAIHLAATTGNCRVLEILIKDYQSNYNDMTLG